MTDTEVVLPGRRGDTDNIQRPDYMADLLELAKQVSTRNDIDAIWASAQRVRDEARHARVRMRQLRDELRLREALLD